MNSRVMFIMTFYHAHLKTFMREDERGNECFVITRIYIYILDREL